MLDVDVDEDRVYERRLKASMPHHKNTLLKTLSY